MPDPADIHFSVLERHFTLRRYPLLPKELHRAWDAADELMAWYLLGLAAADADRDLKAEPLAGPKANHRWPTEPDAPDAAETSEAPDVSIAGLLSGLNSMNPPRCLVVNDTFGCLTLLLASLGLKPWVLNDSWCAMESLWQNAVANEFELDASRFITSHDPLPDDIELVLMRASDRHDERARLDRLLRPHLAPNARILTAAMVKANLHTELGSTLHSSIWRKACVHLTIPDAGESAVESAVESADESEEAEPLTLEHGGKRFAVLPGVFSGRVMEAGPTVDPGTAMLLANLPTAADFAERSEGVDLIDLGSGTGLLGIVMALDLAGSGTRPRSVRFYDESALAVACTSLNAGEHLDDFPEEAVSVHWLDCLTDVAENSADLVLCNPPFHAGNVRTDAVAWRMFTHACRVLRPGGRLRVVGNRHLHYHAKLTKIFGNHKTIKSDRRYVVVEAVKGVTDPPSLRSTKSTEGDETGIEESA